MVPVSSLITAADGTTTVMVAGSDGRAHQKPVKLGIRNGDDVQIVDGVAASDKVVSNGVYGLPDNTKITIATAASSDENKPAAEGSKAGSEASGEK